MLSNLKLTDKKLSIQIKNHNIKPSFVNGLRRVMNAEIEIIAFDIDTFNVSKNTSTINNSILEQRIGLIPINNYIFDKKDFNNITASLNFINDTDEIKSIYADDIVVKDDEKNEILDNNIFFVYPKILFSKIKPKHELNFTIKLTKSAPINKDFNAVDFNPVCPAFYTFNSPDKINSIEEQRNYPKKNNNPELYYFNIESVGQLNAKDIFINAINVITNKLENIILKINNEFQIVKSDVQFDAFDFNILDQCHTIGNLIAKYINEDESNINYCGYIIPHPADNLLIIRTALTNNNTLENNKKTVIDNIKKIIKYYNNLKDDFIKITK